MERTKHEMALMSQIANLRAKLRAKEQELYDERVRKTGVKVGDIVVCKGEQYRVCSIEPMSFGAWVSGNPRKKNGEFGNAVRNLYANWTLANQAKGEAS
jgi:hypothetical protein